ncbi:MAG: redox-regulated ATPase YchF [Candidatus Pacebacteria bacterium]|nr:redox-regulated ATPase YchF [Candidatus Paceibacterota bacterium]
MSLSIGIVGLPNVGKSTLFNALLKKQVALAANYPFATIDPNVGVTEVPDDRLEKLAQIVGTTTIKPATVLFTDIAGLIKGASQGEGLGNQFLAHIRETDAICHVLRAFTDQDVIREGSVSPAQDLATIRTELQLADLETLGKQKPPKGVKEPEELRRWDLIEQFIARLEAGQPVLDWQQITTDQDQVRLQLAKELNLLTSKPELFALNIDEDQLDQANQIKTDYQAKLQSQAGSLPIKPEQIVIISAKIEAELAVLSEDDQVLYMQDLGITESGLERLAKAGYQTLNLQSFLTAGEKEVRAWTIKQGTKAPQAAGTIHTDFEKKFIKAKVVNFDDFVQNQGWLGAKEAGKVRLEGRDYVMQPNDVVEFMVGG